MVDRSGRRSVLRSGAALGSLALAGCLGLDDQDGDGGTPNGSDGTGNESDDGTDTDGNGDDPPPTVDAWPQFQYDAGNTASIDGAGPEDPVEVRWRVDVEDTMPSTPVAADGTVFAANRAGVVRAIDLDSGDVEWDVDVGAEVEETPAVWEDLLLVPNTNGMTAVKRSSGQPEWSFEVDQHPATPTVTDDHVLFGDQSYRFFALNPQSGELDWEFEGPDRSEFFSYPPAIVDGTIVSYASENSIYTFDPDTGEHQSVRPSIDYTINTAPTISDGTLFLGSFEGDVFAYDIGYRYAREQWHFQAEDTITWSPAVSEGNVFVTAESTLHCLDAESGEERWSSVIERDRPISSPSVANSIVYILVASFDGTNIFSFDSRDGERNWAALGGSLHPTHPIIAEGAIVCRDKPRGNLIALGRSE